jgi:hypothetical protein
MERIIFGDNQFFGINHMSEDKAGAQLARFQGTEAILETIDGAYDEGLRGFMFSTHDRVQAVCDHFREFPDRYAGLRLYPVLPYAHKYASAVAEKGVAKALSDVIFAGTSASKVLKTVLHGTVGIFSENPYELMKILVDTELKMFRGLKMDVVFLQNIVGDLLLGLGMAEAFVQFDKYIRSEYHAEPGFMTMNLASMVKLLKEAGLKNPIVCSPINKIGYLMNPSRESVEETIEAGEFRPVAMSILASGAIPAHEAVAYVCGQRNIESLIFGASSMRNILETKALIEELSVTPVERETSEAGG